MKKFKLRHRPQTIDAHLQLLSQRSAGRACRIFCVAALAGSTVVFAPLPVKIIGGMVAVVTLPVGLAAAANSATYANRRRKFLKTGLKPRL